MRAIALKMLFGDTAKFLGMLFGVSVAAFLITQQGSIFCGLMSRTFGFLSDTSLPDIWVMDRKVQFVDDIKPLSDTQLYRVRGVEGVEWAVPLYKGQIKARLPDGSFQTCNVIGLDDATLIGGPPRMLQGNLQDLRRAEGVIVDETGANDKLAHKFFDENGNEIRSRRKPLVVGDTLELNDRRAVVVGICRVTPTFQSQPVVYTTYSRATTFAPRERKLLSFVLVKARQGVPLEELCTRISAATDLMATPTDQFKRTTVLYFMKYTGIPINFGIAVLLGFVVGTAIAGLLFYQFTQDNLRHFGALKAMGAGNFRLLGMILLQSLVVGVLGYGIGVGLAAFMGATAGKTALAFFMPWWLPLVTAGAILLICLFSSLLSVVRVVRLEPAIVFKS
jgi:putative ABC transport system permease protein